MKKKFYLFILIFFCKTSCAYVLYNAIDLVNPLRFDLMAKYIYAQSREQNIQSTWPLEVYGAHIKVWGNFIEVNSHGGVVPEKIGLGEYLTAFHVILDSVKKEGLDPNKSLVPVGKKSLSNGAHRVTACLLYNKKVPCSRAKVKGVIATVEYFQNRTKHVPGGLHEKYLDAMAFQYCKLKQSTSIIILFSAHQNALDKIKQLFSHYDMFVYKKKISLTPRGTSNLIKILYLNDKQKQLTKNRPINIYVALIDRIFKHREKPIKWALNVLEHIEEPFYITHSYDQVIELAGIFFNQNSIRFVNTAHCGYFDLFEKCLETYKKKLKQKQCDSDSTCIVGNAILAAYGIKECTQLESIDNTDHRNDDIIFNPQNHFYYKNLKFKDIQI